MVVALALALAANTSAQPLASPTSLAIDVCIVFILRVPFPATISRHQRSSDLLAATLV
jgi:hypothetical protein